ncbi:MAG: LpxI family protein [Nitrospinaceae bacterium]
MNPTTPYRIGLIAGSGEIPLYFARKAFKNGIPLVSIGFTDEIQSRLVPFAEKTYSIGVGKPSKIFRILKEEKIRDVLILGKVDKNVIFRPQLFDLRSLRFLKNIKSKEDRTLMEGVIREVEKEGFRVLDQRQFLREIYPDAGVLTRRKPSPEEMEDIEFGFPIAKKLADMEIGQTIIVKNKTVVAVEAIEGTDRAIDRGCALVQGKCVAIKVSRTHQDYRYDSPGVGLKTLEGLTRGGARVLALEAGRVMLVEQSQVLEMADRAGVSIVCVASDTASPTPRPPGERKK